MPTILRTFERTFWLVLRARSRYVSSRIRVVAISKIGAVINLWIGSSKDFRRTSCFMLSSRERSQIGVKLVMYRKA